jgi:toxin ParE1/3/4
MAVLVSPQIEAELDDVWLYIANESASPDVADRIVDAIVEHFALLSKHPHLGRKRDDLRRGLRSMTVGSYVVIYRLQGSDVFVLHVLHGRRDITQIVRQ